MEESFDAAIQAYEEALAVGRSDPSVHLGLCRLWGRLGQLRISHGNGPPEPALDTADRVCSDAMIADEERVGTRLALVEIIGHRAERRMGKGLDPEPALARAEELAQATIWLDPDHSEPHRMLARTWWQRSRRLRADRSPAAFIDAEVADGRWNEEALESTLAEALAGIVRAIEEIPSYRSSYDVYLHLVEIEAERRHRRGLGIDELLQEARSLVRRLPDPEAELARIEALRRRLIEAL